ncbi:hypothetical protein [Paracoccus mutanolyticus]|uniref:hypothetical protein n=1 Tax=Paracoccus mutanolyticus TaxID=1499308 RepID=UPI0011AE5FA6|nr:hypothetical protein [Paracoccus mutanolyticus]
MLGVHIMDRHDLAVDGDQLSGSGRPELATMLVQRADAAGILLGITVSFATPPISLRGGSGLAARASG